MDPARSDLARPALIPYLAAIYLLFGFMKKNNRRKFCKEGWWKEEFPWKGVDESEATWEDYSSSKHSFEDEVVHKEGGLSGDRRIASENAAERAAEGIEG